MRRRADATPAPVGMSDDEARAWLRRAAVRVMPATSEPGFAEARRMLAVRAKLAALSRRAEHEDEPPLPLVAEARAVLARHGLERASSDA